MLGFVNKLFDTNDREVKKLQNEVVAATNALESKMEALPDLAARLTVKVEADRALLTDRERELFETHILGQLGDELRGVRRQAGQQDLDHQQQRQRSAEDALALVWRGGTSHGLEFLRAQRLRIN